ncbi:hypothetical protein ACTFIU_009352 [Dictyostelium citrinum]
MDNNYNNSDNNNSFEILFWKVFKNIFLFNFILKVIKSNQTLRKYSYNEINRVEWMIENGYFELLKEKIKRCDSLVFNCRFKHPTIMKGSMMATMNRVLTEKRFDFKYSIFNFYKDDFQLFSMLFKNYNLYFQLPSSCKNIERISVELDNIAALKVLVENYSFTPEISSFFKSYEIGSTSVSQYLYQSLFLKSNKKLTKDQIDQLWCLTFSNIFTKPSTTSTPSSKFISIANQINEKEIANDIMIKKLLFIVNEIKLKPTIFNLKPLESFFNFKIYKESLSKLLFCCKIVSILSNFQSLHQLFNQQLLKEKTFIQDIKIKTSIKALEKTLIMASALNLSNNTVLTTKSLNNKQSLEKPIQLISLILFDELNKMKFTKKELSTSVYTLIDNLNHISSSSTVIITIENIKKLYEMFIKFTTFGKNNLLDNFTFIRIKFYNESFSKLESFNSFTNQSIIGFFKNDKVEIIEKLCKENKLLINLDTSPYYYMKSIEMFDTIYNYDKEKNRLILLSILFNYKIVNHFKNSYSKHYQILIASADISPKHLKQFSFQSFNFIFENWLDFTNRFKEKIVYLIMLNISSNKIPLTDYINFIEFLKIENELLNRNINIPFYHPLKNSNTSFKDIELDYTTFEQVSYLIDQHYYQNEKNKSIIESHHNAPIFCIYYLRGELNKIIFQKEQSGSYDLILLVKEIVKKSDIKSFQFISSQNQQSNYFIHNVLSYSLYYGNFILFHKSLNQEKLPFINGDMISEAFENGQIETLLYLKKQLNNYKPNQSFEKLINDNNCFFFNYFKNLK